jgi:hypothetical protein
MTDLDEYASAAAPASETYESGSAFDMPLLPSCGPSSAGSRSQAVPIIHFVRVISQLASSGLTTNIVIYPEHAVFKVRKD